MGVEKTRHFGNPSAYLAFIGFVRCLTIFSGRLTGTRGSFVLCYSKPFRRKGLQKGLHKKAKKSLFFILFFYFFVDFTPTRKAFVKSTRHFWHVLPIIATWLDKFCKFHQFINTDNPCSKSMICTQVALADMFVKVLCRATVQFRRF